MLDVVNTTTGSCSAPDQATISSSTSRPFRVGIFRSNPTTWAGGVREPMLPTQDMSASVPALDDIDVAASRARLERLADSATSPGCPRPRHCDVAPFRSCLRQRE